MLAETDYRLRADDGPSMSTVKAGIRGSDEGRRGPRFSIGHVIPIRVGLTTVVTCAIKWSKLERLESCDDSPFSCYSPGLRHADATCRVHWALGGQRPPSYQICCSPTS